MKHYYHLAPDISVMDMKDGSVLFKSDTLSIKLEGKSAQFLQSNILPLLTGDNEIEEVCNALPGMDLSDLKTNLNELVQSGVLVRGEQPVSAANKNTAVPFFDNLLEVLRTPEVNARSLEQITIAVVGLEAHGTQTVLALQQAGIVNFKLIDPFEMDAGYIQTFPFLTPTTTRQESLKKYLLEKTNCKTVETGPENITRQSLEDTVSDCQLMIACFDKAFSAAFYWCNQISIEKKIPVLYSAIKGNSCFAGPFVIPGKTACYMCYKMRNVATEEDFEEAMTYEEHLNGIKKPSFNNRFALPAALNWVAGILSTEVLKYFLGFAPVSLAGGLMQFDTFTFTTSTHHILIKPDCPVCQKKKTGKSHLSLKKLLQPSTQSNLPSLLNRLVSTHTGIIKKLEIVPKDATEPSLPLVYFAELSNHSFATDAEQSKLNCSGKGMDASSAKTSAVGEAVERYSGTIYSSDDIIFSSYSKIADVALHPKELVLYLPHQYKEINFSPFDPDVEIGWVKGHSLVKDEPIYLPAQTAILNYHFRHKNESICQTTSNGLAAGASLIQAILAAAEEVIERDAFIITWHNELPIQQIDAFSHPQADLTAFCESYRRRGVDIKLFKLPSDTPLQIFMAAGYQEKGLGPTIVVGLGADFSAQKAARKAILEVGQVRPAFKQRLRSDETQQRLQKLLQDHQRVESLEDHDLLYAVPDTIAAFDFLFHQPMKEYEWDKNEDKTASEKLTSLIDYCRKQQYDFVYYNLTPPDMESLGLFTARVVISDFQPIHFGAKNIRLGGERLFSLPQRLGFRNRTVTVEELNPHPHPLA